MRPFKRIKVVSSDNETLIQVEEAPKMLKLVSSDNETFQVEEAVAKESQMIKFMIEDECGMNTIPIPNVTGRILAMVIEHCKRHVEFTKSSDEYDQAAEKTDALKKLDKEFVNVDKSTIFELINAASYLNIRSLLDLTCQATADRIKNFSPAEVRDFFNIQNDFTPEEEEEVRRENAWAFN